MLDTTRIYYLCQPYSNINKAETFQLALEIICRGFQEGVCVFSPIANSHCAERWREKTFPQMEVDYLLYDLTLLMHWVDGEKVYERAEQSSLRLIVLGDWAKSRGVNVELSFAHDLHIPCYSVHPDVLISRNQSFLNALVPLNVEDIPRNLWREVWEKGIHERHEGVN